MTDEKENSLPKIRRVKIADLIPDRQNANLGTERGLRVLDSSLRENGVGRSILVDRDGEIIAGNKTTERAADLGFEDVIIVESDGRSLIAVQRTDLDLDSDDPRARRLAIADNRVAELDLEWNAETLLELAREDPEIVAGLWTSDEWEETVLSQLADNETEDERDAETLLDQAVQLKPQNEYAMILAETPEQWETLRQILDLQPVRRGGYKVGSVFDHVGTQRVVRFDNFLDLIEDYIRQKTESE